MDENYNFTFVNELGEDGPEDHVYTVGANTEERIARIFAPGVQTYTSSQQLAEFGMLCFAISPLDDDESVGELIDGLMGDDARFELAKRLRSLADSLEDV